MVSSELHFLIGLFGDVLHKFRKVEKSIFVVGLVELPSVILRDLEGDFVTFAADKFIHVGRDDSFQWLSHYDEPKVIGILERGCVFRLHQPCLLQERVGIKS